MDAIDAHRRHVESHVPYELEEGDLGDPPGSSGRVPVNVSSLDEGICVYCNTMKNGF